MQLPRPWSSQPFIARRVEVRGQKVGVLDSHARVGYLLEPAAFLELPGSHSFRNRESAALAYLRLVECLREAGFSVNYSAPTIRAPPACYDIMARL